jgi:branched-subunit amino acid ABC-type transport system permease component
MFLNMLFGIFRKMQASVHRKVENNDPSLYISLAFPTLFAFVITFLGSRLIGYLITYGVMPPMYYQPSPGLHVHHFTYGVFILFLAGYLGLSVKQARAKFWVALLLGFGLGLAMDEFGMWLRLRDDEIVRWSYDGFNIIIGLFLLILSLKPGIRMLKRAWPFGKRGY